MLVKIRDRIKKIRTANTSIRNLVFFSFITMMILLGTTSAVVVKTIQDTNGSVVRVQEKPVQVTSFDPEIIRQWRIRVIYNNKTDSLSLKDISEVNSGLPDYRLAKFSPFSFQILDKNGNELFGRNIMINQFWLDHFDSEGKVIPIENIESEIYIPYFENGKGIIINQNDKKMLEIPISQKSAMHFIKQSYAQTPQQRERACGPITTVFISQNYSNSSEFHTDVQKIVNFFKTVTPYTKDFDTIFNFKEAYTTETVGLDEDSVRKIGKQASPQATKFVLVDKTIQGGGVNGVGGDIALSTNIPEDQTHEFLGHMVGLLHDRNWYGYELKNFFGPPSNCAGTNAGQPFWKDALKPNSPNITQVCFSKYWYAPTDKDTAKRTTIMYAYGGSGGKFDTVEQYWIENNVLPNLRACPEAGNSQTPNTNNTSTCGGWHQACCADKKCTYEVTVCTENKTCELCGALNEPCCNPSNNKIGIACINNLSCTSNHCCNPGQTWNGTQCIEVR